MQWTVIHLESINYCAFVAQTSFYSSSRAAFVSIDDGVAAHLHDYGGALTPPPSTRMHSSPHFFVYALNFYCYYSKYAPQFPELTIAVAFAPKTITPAHCDHIFNM